MKKVSMLSGVRERIKAFPSNLAGFVIKHKILIGGLLSLVLIGVVLAVLPKPHSEPVHRPPKLSISEPQVVDNGTLIVRGRTEPGIRVLADEVVVPVQADGTFRLMLTGSQVSSRLMRVVATDRYGAKTVEEVDIIPPDEMSKGSYYNPPPDTQSGLQSGGQVANVAFSVQPAKGQGTPAIPRNPQVSSSMVKPSPVDLTPPSLEITAPTTTSTAQVIIEGVTRPGVLVSVNYLKTRAGSDGRFKLYVVLKEKGKPNTVIVTVGDPGRQTTKSVTINWD